MTVPSYNQLLMRQRTEMSEGLFAATRRLKYTAERLADERQRRLRDLLSVAARRPFYRVRLAAAGISPATATEADLARIEPLTKPEMMANFDDIVDPALSRDAVEAHLEQLVDDDYLDGRYRVLATGGSSDIRGIFVYGWRDWIEFALMQARWSVQQPALDGVVGSTFARRAEHVSGALHAFFADDATVCHVPATLSIQRSVATLNEAQPTKLQGYPSSIKLLASEAAAGRLQIAPRAVSTCGEMVTKGVRINNEVLLLFPWDRGVWPLIRVWRSR